ncbi:MAG: diacylglycerol kinase family lipid kinase [Bacteroidaceae bacterium]|nr:diacylglycerol kinase family lipid kinase [Bacteroidaceae bacterium]
MDYFCVPIEKNMTKILFIVNPISGTTTKARIVELIPKYMDAAHFDVHIQYTSHRGHAAEIACQAVQDGFDVVVAVGGDGTVNEVARSLVHTPTALGIIPCGSGNGLARHLFIPMNPVGALQVLADCQIKSLDYGVINGTPFFCTCGVGFDAFVSDKFAKSGRRGLLTYIENTLREGVRYKPEVYDIEIDGNKQTYKAFLIACANASQYGNDVYIAPHASMSDGLMDVTIMEPFSVFEAPQIAVQLFNKSIDNNSRIHSYRCKSLVIHRSSPGVIHFDGDPKDEPADIQVELIAKGIRMVVNVNEQPYVPPLLRTFTNLYADMNIDSIRQDLADGHQKIRSINKELLNKLRPHKPE